MLVGAQYASVLADVPRGSGWWRLICAAGPWGSMSDIRESSRKRHQGPPAVEDTGVTSYPAIAPPSNPAVGQASVLAAPSAGDDVGGASAQHAVSVQQQQQFAVATAPTYSPYSVVGGVDYSGVPDALASPALRSAYPQQYRLDTPPRAIRDVSGGRSLVQTHHHLRACPRRPDLHQT